MVRKTKTSDLQKMGRRRFTKTLAALGLSTQTIQGLNAEELEELTDDPAKQVPHAKIIRNVDAEEWNEPPFPKRPPERELEYTTIPRDQFIDRETAYDAALRVKNRIFDRHTKTPGIGSSVTLTKQGMSDEYTVKVTIEKGRLPENYTAQGLKSQLESEFPSHIYGEVDNNESSSTAISKSEVKNPGENARADIPIEFSVTKIVDAGCEHDCTGEDTRHYKGFKGEHYDDTTYIPSGHSIHVKRGTYYEDDPDGPIDNSSSTLGLSVYDTTGVWEFGFLITAHSVYSDWEDASYDYGEDDDVDEGDLPETDDPDAAIGVNRPVYQNWSGDSGVSKIGEVDRHAYHRIYDRHHPGENSQRRMDAAFVRLNDESVPEKIQTTNHLAGEEGCPVDREFEISNGIIAEDEVKDLKNGSNRVIVQGRRSGRCERELVEVEPDYPGIQRLEFKRDDFEENVGGNSGGPLFAEVYGDNVALGMVRAQTEEGNPPDNGHFRTLGLYLPRIEEQLNVYYVTGPEIPAPKTKIETKEPDTTQDDTTFHAYIPEKYQYNRDVIFRYRQVTKDRDNDWNYEIVESSEWEPGEIVSATVDVPPEYVTEYEVRAGVGYSDLDGFPDPYILEEGTTQVFETPSEPGGGGPGFTLPIVATGVTGAALFKRWRDNNNE